MPEQQFTKEMTEALNTRAVKVKKIKLVLSGQPNLIFLLFKEEIFFHPDWGPFSGGWYKIRRLADYPQLVRLKEPAWLGMMQERDNMACCPWLSARLSGVNQPHWDHWE